MKYFYRLCILLFCPFWLVGFLYATAKRWVHLGMVDELRAGP